MRNFVRKFSSPSPPSFSCFNQFMRFRLFSLRNFSLTSSKNSLALVSVKRGMRKCEPCWMWSNIIYWIPNIIIYSLAKQEKCGICKCVCDGSGWIMDMFDPSVRVVMSLKGWEHVWKTIFSRSNPSWIFPQSHDWLLHNLITAKGGFWWCVTEPETESRKISNNNSTRAAGFASLHHVSLSPNVAHKTRWQQIECS